MIDLARSPAMIGSILRNARRGKGLTQTQLAELTALRQETISMIETGHAPTVQTLLTVLSALDLELSIFPRSKGEWMNTPLRPARKISNPRTTKTRRKPAKRSSPAPTGHK